jgi:cell division septation protein DedD
MQYSHHQVERIRHHNPWVPMIPGGESKRKLGDVWPQLVLSAGVLLLPPLVMTAFVMHFGSPSSPGVGQQVVERADGRQLATSFALASADQRPVIIERRRVADGPATSTINQTTNDPKRYTPAGNQSEQSVMAEVMAPTDISAKVSEQLPDARRRSPVGATASLAVPQTAIVAIEESHPSASARPTPHANETGAWVVQLSAQKTEGEAQSAHRAAQAKYPVLAGYQLLVRKKDQGARGTFYAAQVGPLPRSEANELCDNLKSAGASCFSERSLR